MSIRALSFLPPAARPGGAPRSCALICFVFQVFVGVESEDPRRTGRRRFARRPAVSFVFVFVSASVSACAGLFASAPREMWAALGGATARGRRSIVEHMYQLSRAG